MNKPVKIKCNNCGNISIQNPDIILAAPNVIKTFYCEKCCKCLTKGDYTEVKG